jgi:enediyne biosynthesis protein E4
MKFTDVSYSSGIASSTTPYVGWGDGSFDFDNDGSPDFSMVNGHVYPQVDSIGMDTRYREPKLLSLNQHDGKFKTSVNCWARHSTTASQPRNGHGRPV